MYSQEEFSQDIGLLPLSLVGVLVGSITGLGAVAFRAMIAVVHNFLFLGEFSPSYDANVYTAINPWGVGVIAIPVIGGLVVTFLVTKFAPETRGHGVPEVMDAIFYKEGRIRPAVAAVKSLASAFSIGSGASVGREGPIIQIGASIGSTVGTLIQMETWQRITLVAAGAGAGIAATFNTPIGGVLFAIEIMLPEISVRTFLPVALATGTATWIGHVFFGQNPAFVLPDTLSIATSRASFYALLLYAVVGALAGLAATAFIRGLHAAEGAFSHIANPYLRHMLGMSIVGTMMYTLFSWQGHYYIEGVGYATIQSILGDAMVSLPLLMLLCLCKLTATCVSLGSGSSGGIFSPSLFIGATLGAGFGASVTAIDPSAGVTIPACSMVGMAAVVAGATGAAMTAVTMIFEMTRDYDIVMPMIIAVAVSVGIRRLLSKENIYTIKLVGRRHFIPKALHANMLLVQRAGERADTNFVTLSPGSSMGNFLHNSEHDGGLRHIVVSDNGKIVGVLRVNLSLRRGLEAAYSDTVVGDVASHSFTIAREDDIMFDVIRRMWRHNATMAVVVSKLSGVPHIGDVVGIISKEHIANSVADSIRPYGTSGVIA